MLPQLFPPGTDKYPAKRRKTTNGKFYDSVSDSELLAIATSVLNTITGAPASWGATPAVVAALDTKHQTFLAELDAHVTAQAAAKSRTTSKNGSRVILEDALRSLRNVAKAANTSQALMDSLAIPTGSVTAPPTATFPSGKVDTGERLRHTISWTDNATPGNKRKPIGAMGAEIWLKLEGPPPTDEKQCTFLTLDSKTPYLSEYPGTDAGKMAHYMLRWRMSDGSTTAWGETLSATITG